MNYYVGNLLQIRGAEQYTLQGAKGNGMRFICVRNGLGLEAWITLDRCADISRLSFKGDNMGYFSPCGYVSPKYYEPEGAGFLDSFTAGFFTTCGFNNVGGACEDGDERLPMHGSISNIPAELKGVFEDEDAIKIMLEVRDCRIFGSKLCLHREYTFSYLENTFSFEDKITNESDKPAPFMLLYHCNMGYPLLDEHSEAVIPNLGFKARDERAQSQLNAALDMEKPQAGYEECCYYYDVKESGGRASVGVFGKTIGKGVVLSYDKQKLPCFTEWKMMGKRDYVLGLEPGNCNPEGRAALREAGRLEFIEPEKSRPAGITFRFAEDGEEFKGFLDV